MGPNMMGILLDLVWALIGERLTQRVKSAYERFRSWLVPWFTGLPLLARCAVFAIAGSVAIFGAMLVVFGSSRTALQTAQEFAAAARNSRDLYLSPKERTRGNLYVGIWSEVLLDRYEQQLNTMTSGKQISGAATWSVAQKLVALNGLNATKLHAEDALEYFSKEMDQDCGCWSGFYDPDHKGSSPLNVAVSAWIITALQRAVPQPQPPFADFLKKARLSSGAWPVLRSNADEEGSTFATPWAIMALISLQARMPENPEIATEIRKGVNWLLDNRRPDGLWTLYPQGTRGGAHRVSLSNSGLAIVALHQALRAEATVVPESVLTQWRARLTLADRELLHHLKPGVAVDESESYNDSLPTTSEGMVFERVQLLVLPWLVMGAVEAYPSGNVLERMKAVGFLDDFGRRLEEVNKEIRRPGNEWRIPEMLMALRSWVDDSYLSGAPVGREQVSHDTAGLKRPVP